MLKYKGFCDGLCGKEIDTDLMCPGHLEKYFSASLDGQRWFIVGQDKERIFCRECFLLLKERAEIKHKAEQYATEEDIHGWDDSHATRTDN